MSMLPLSLSDPEEGPRNLGAILFEIHFGGKKQGINKELSK